MKVLGRFNLCVIVIWLVLLGLASLADNGDIPPIFIFLCISLLFVLPTVVVINVIWLIVLAVIGLRRKQTILTGRHDRRQIPVEVTLTEYLRGMKSVMSDEEVNRKCRANGWSHEDIQKARRLLSGKPV